MSSRCARSSYGYAVENRPPVQDKVEFKVSQTRYRPSGSESAWMDHLPDIWAACCTWGTLRGRLGGLRPVVGKVIVCPDKSEVTAQVGGSSNRR